MTTFIKTKVNKSDDQTNKEKYRAAANITEYHIISKIIFRRIIIPKFMKKRQLFRVKNVKINMFKMDVLTFSHNCRVATLSTLYLTVSGIIILSLNSIERTIIICLN